MTEAAQQLLVQVRQYVVNLLHTKLNPAFIFHNLDHTKDVVKSSELLADYYKISEEDRLPLLVAAWFHDTGYINGIAKGHEYLSQKIASEFLQGKADDGFIAKVNRCIDSTRVPQSPASQIEMIMCDADLFHLGTESFDERNKLLRKEINKLNDTKISKKEWHKKNLHFLQQHQYFTSYGKEKLEPIKQKFIREIESKIAAEEKDEVVKIDFQTPQGTEPVAAQPPLQYAGVTGQSPINPVLTSNHITSPGPSSQGNSPQAYSAPLVSTGKNKPDKEISKRDAERLKRDTEALTAEIRKLDSDKMKKDSKVERSIATMFRIISDNHVSLSQMADSKANIMISVNTIVMSILVSVLLGKLQFYPEYILPTIILLGVCLSAVVFSILATRPNVSSGTFTKEDIINKKVNLLFFGNFYNMDLQDYDWAMKEMMSDREYLNSSMIKDIYFLGVVLARKYKYLRISYNIFMFGLVVAIVAFGIAFVVSEA
ncbi:MAG: phosphohydrolase [Proteobacteria bacterium]|nr:MAG: phosphohydrolase [Pseudomonadota bacterium]